jgi:hypothetical protein
LDDTLYNLRTDSWTAAAEFWKDFDMKSKTLRMLTFSQAGIVLLFLCLTVGNEIVDIPHTDLCQL